MTAAQHSWQSDCPTFKQIHHNHDFGQGRLQKAEKRAWAVALLTLVVMFAEVIAGLITGSMALLADGIHMGGHAIALGLAAMAYFLARRYAEDRRLSFGSGKIKDLAAYTSALLLALSSVWLVVESVHRLLTPESLHAFEAMIVAIVGLVVNVASIFLLSDAHEHHHHDHSHGHTHGQDHHHVHHHEHDNNIKAALFHVIADAVTSVAAILGLAAAWLWGWNWLDPAIALVAAILIIRWSWGLLKSTGSILLDAEAPAELRNRIKERLESVSEAQVSDLHLWSVGQGNWTLVASVVTHHPHSPDDFKNALNGIEGLHHPMVEVHLCEECSSSRHV